MIDRRFLDVGLVVQGIADKPNPDIEPTLGMQYIVGEMPEGDFENAEPAQIARFDGEKWEFSTPNEKSLEVINAETGEILKFDGVIWDIVATISASSGNSDGSGTSILVVEDLAQVVASSDDLPKDYVMNFCIVDNGNNIPQLYGYYAYNNSYDFVPCYDGTYGDLAVDTVFAGDNGKYYTLKPIADGKCYMEVAEIPVGTLVLCKAIKSFYQYKEEKLELVASGDNQIQIVNPTLDSIIIVEKISNYPDFGYSRGTQYIVGSNPSSSFGECELNDIARYNGEKWIIRQPDKGMICFNLETKQLLKFNGTEWETFISFPDYAKSGERSLGFNLTVQAVANDCKEEYPSVPFEGEQYIVGANPTGDFSGAVANQIARYNGSSWDFITPKTGDIEVFNLETDEILRFDGTAWISKVISEEKFFVIYDFAINSSSRGDYTEEDLNRIFGTVLINTNHYYKTRWPQIFVRNIGYVDDNYVTYYPCSFASNTDGKIYSINDEITDTDTLSSKEIPDGATLYNIHTDALYLYHASNKSFERLTHKIYVVDGIIDFMKHNFDTEPQKVLIQEGSRRITTRNERYKYGTLAMQEYQNDNWVSFDDEFVAVGKKYLAREDVWHDRVRIFEHIPHTTDNSDWRTIFAYNDWIFYDIEAGDTVINKEDGITYIFDGENLIAVSEAKLPLSVTSTGTILPETAVTGDSFINTETFKFYKAMGTNIWNSGTAIPKGYMFLNEADGKMYFFNGSDFISLGG